MTDQIDLPQSSNDKVPEISGNVKEYGILAKGPVLGPVGLFSAMKYENMRN